MLLDLRKPREKATENYDVFKRIKFPSPSTYLVTYKVTLGKTWFAICKATLLLPCDSKRRGKIQFVLCIWSGLRGQHHFCSVLPLGKYLAAPSLSIFLSTISGLGNECVIWV